MSKAGDRFGEIAVREGYASRSAVRECLEIQAKLKGFGVEPKRLGEIMVEKGYLGLEDVEEILDLQRQTGSRMDSRSGLGRRRTRTTASIEAGHKAPAPQVPGFEIQGLIGEGGMGVVYKARQQSLDRVVALKILPPSVAQEKAYIERFIREARTVARLKHENIIKGIDVGAAQGTYYFAMEYVQGETLANMIRREGALDEEQALEITLQIARALEHAHEHGLVHRDVKPQNVLMTRKGTAKLCDLGLAKSSYPGAPDQTDPQGVPIGTPHYVSPEQAKGEADVDIRSDIYSLGATAYHMLTGETPFEGPSPMVLMTKHITEEPEDPRELNEDLSRGAAELVLWMMTKEKDDRPQTPEELVDEVERVLEGKRPRVPKGTARKRRRGGGGGSARSGAVKRARGGGGGEAPRRAHVVRSKPSNHETTSLILIPVVIVLMLIAAGWAFLAPTGFEDLRQITPALEAEADAELRQFRKIESSDPQTALKGYLWIEKEYAGTKAARLAADYRRELQSQ